jgi:hypothetical protein
LERNGRRPRTRWPIERDRAAAPKTARREVSTDRAGDGEEPVACRHRGSGAGGRRPELRDGVFVTSGKAR